MQVGVFRRMQAGAGRVVRSGPAFPVVVQIAEHIEVFLPAGRAGVERLAAGQFHTRNDKMQFVVSRVAVPYPQNIALIRLQARERHLFKAVHDAPFLFRRHPVVGMPGKYPGGEFPLGIQRVYQGTGSFHIPAQDFRRQLVAARIIRAHKVVRGGFPGAWATTLAVRKDFHIHANPPVPGAGVCLSVPVPD